MIKPRIIIVIALLAIFIWTMFAPPPILVRLKMNLANIARLPLKMVSASVNSISKISKFFYLDNEKTELKRKVFSLERKLIELREVSIENKRLKDLLSLKSQVAKNSVAAAVIGRDPNNWASVIFIDKGRNNGIVKDMAVVSSQGLVGRVREVGKNLSKVLLINDVDSKVAGLLQRSREQGLLVGTPEGRCKIIYLSLEADINKNDVVITSGSGSIYPKGMLIGEVVSVAKEKGTLYKYAVVKPYAELSKLEEVICIK
ncbi:MAG: rod shape-determining protein MreC [Candidatus Omnitrophica bacterium]|nr:rod shape-determining protein MreC [Candidatus Omnitrophota bacterium]MBU4487991.1 rod shape-determining protein MreC [Candidatus Omnitrophota bacterium]MCG2704766.1 rod shape-determining protein MreC [Candidatus Omnitrophota bacterium]